MAGKTPCHHEIKIQTIQRNHTSEERPKIVRFGVASEDPAPLNNVYPVAQKSL
jgi:hypothetical protein